MQGLVTLDFGNTNPHAGLFKKVQGDWELLKVVTLAALDEELHSLQMNSGNTTMVLSEVKPRDDEIKKLQEQGYLITRVKDYWRGTKFAGMPVHYANTLGEDRLIEAFYAYKKIKRNTLIINSGTFVTMDVVTSEGFQGGYIIPGIESYLEFYKKGEQLKHVPLEGAVKNELPHLTADAMRDSYSAFGALAKNLQKNFDIETILLTGGTYKLWEEILDFPSSGAVEDKVPHLIHSALHYWMTTQIEIL